MNRHLARQRQHDDGMTPHPLEEQWRARAAKLTAWGATEAARFWELAADELGAFETEQALEVLSVATAADEAGVSPDTVRRALDEGRVALAAEGGQSGVRRQDLPKLRKGRKSPPRLASGEPDLVAKVGEAGGLRPAV